MAKYYYLKFMFICLKSILSSLFINDLLYFSEENRIKFSVEVEKVGRNHEEFIPYADLVLVSKVRLRTQLPE